MSHRPDWQLTPLDLRQAQLERVAREAQGTWREPEAARIASNFRRRVLSLKAKRAHAIGNEPLVRH